MGELAALAIKYQDEGSSAGDSAGEAGRGGTTAGVRNSTSSKRKSREEPVNV